MEPIPTQTFFGVRYVPLATTVEGLGGSVDWDNAAKRATVHLSGKTILATMESTSVEANGETIAISQPPLVQDGVLYVPEDFFTNVVGQSVPLA